jgi:hemoglobin
MRTKKYIGKLGAWRSAIRIGAIPALSLAGLLVVAISGCGTTDKKEKNDEFFTSGNREADQRASQRMAKAEQLSGSGEGAGEKDKSDSKNAKAEQKLALYERLGGDAGIAKIVDDFLARALEDPRVNWQRIGVTLGGFSFHHNQPVTWKATPANVAGLKKHMAQFFALATGGPARYDGEEMRSAHENLHITNAEFDAAVGDLKASLDRLKIPNQEQKELLAIVESTRPQIVEER